MSHLTIITAIWSCLSSPNCIFHRISMPLGYLLKMLHSKWVRFKRLNHRFVRRGRLGNLQVARFLDLWKRATIFCTKAFVSMQNVKFASQTRLANASQTRFFFCIAKTSNHTDIKKKNIKNRCSDFDLFLDDAICFGLIKKNLLKIVRWSHYSHHKTWMKHEIQRNWLKSSKCVEWQKTQTQLNWESQFETKAFRSEWIETQLKGAR